MWFYVGCCTFFQRASPSLKLSSNYKNWKVVHQPWYLLVDVDEATLEKKKLVAQLCGRRDSQMLSCDPWYMYATIWPKHQ